MEILGLIGINDWLLLFLGLVVALYFYTTIGFNYWTRQGVPGPKPLPFYLNYKYLAQEGLKLDTRLVKEFGKTVGAFEGTKPYLITTDDDILREVFVKQFHNFANRRDQEFPEKSGLQKSILFMPKEGGWKRVRDLMSPTFSSGKLKQMTDRMNECSKFYLTAQKDAAARGGEINLKESFGPVAMSLIATVAFGIDMNNTVTYEEFSDMGRRISSNQSSFKMALQFFNFMAPKLANVFITAFNMELMDFGPFIYFGKVVDQILDTRDKGDKAKDFIQLMANANEEATGPGGESRDDKDGMTKEEIKANGINFFLAGYDTVSAGLAVLFYALTVHPEAQEKAYAEVAEILNKKDHLDYEDVQKMTYLDWCLSEALRMYGFSLKVERRAAQDVTIKGIHIKKDMMVSIPVLHLHYDEDRWDNPNAFRPERFSVEEKKDRSPFSWMPFGYGPRNCIGMRLAILEVKIVAAHALYNFRMEPCSKTKIPYEFSKFGLIDGDNVKITKR